MGQPRALRKIGSTDEMNRMQDYVQDALSPITASPILNGVLLKDVDLSASATAIGHKLGRIPQGWIVVDKNANEDIWSTDKTRSLLTLVASGDVTVTIWVF